MKKKVADPLVSVILPIYNGEKYLGEAINSILHQTYCKLEVIVIDDGSSDGSFQILDNIKDPRLRLLKQSNHGLAWTLNRGIQLSKGRYIVRQDQDDFSHPLRVLKQVTFLEAHQEYAMVGTWAKIIDDKGVHIKSHKHPIDDVILKWELLFDNPFVHSSMMIRKNCLNEVGGYSVDPKRQPPEDYELWSRLSRRFMVGNIPELLHTYRCTPGGMSRATLNPFQQMVIMFSKENIEFLLEKKDNNIELLSKLTHTAPSNSMEALPWGCLESLLFEAAKKLAKGDVVAQGRLFQLARLRFERLEQSHLKSRWRNLAAGVKRLLCKIAGFE